MKFETWKDIDLSSPFSDRKKYEMSRKKINLEDAIDFITGGDLSDMNDLSEESDFEELPGTHFTGDEDDFDDLEDEEDDVPISSIQNKKQCSEDLGGDELDDNQNNDAAPSKKRKFDGKRTPL